MTNWHKSNLVTLSIHEDLQVWNEFELIHNRASVLRFVRFTQYA
jgi:hypothetical protein